MLFFFFFCTCDLLVSFILDVSDGIPIHRVTRLITVNPVISEF